MDFEIKEIKSMELKNTETGEILLNLEKKEIFETEAEFRKEIFKLALDDFLGLAQILGVDIFTFDNHIRKDFKELEEEMVRQYSSLGKKRKNKFLRKVREVTKYNRTHKLFEKE